QYACDRARSSKCADHVRSVPIFEEPALSRRKCVHFLRSRTNSRIANGAVRDRHAPSTDRPLYPPGGKAIGAKVRPGVAELYQAPAPMPLNPPPPPTPPPPTT